MDLYLVRHAIAAARDPEAWPDDGERPLTERGVRRFREAALGLRSLTGPVDVVLSSPYRRAWDTAQILHSVAGWPAPERTDPLAVDDAQAVLRAIEAYGTAKSIAVVGHEPQLSQLAVLMLSPGASPFVEMKKGGVARIALEAPGQPSGAKLRWLLPPRVLRSLA